jgi:aryl-alcohol dehydrogenase-like predicted oxidoreductase
LKNLGIETLDVFCMSRADPNVPIEESVGGMAEFVKEEAQPISKVLKFATDSLLEGAGFEPSVPATHF